MPKVFLGGTCNKSKWRDKLISMLKVDYFNPVVDNWTPECQAEEIKQRENCDYCLYVITPRMTGVYSIAEVVDDSNKRPEKTLFAVMAEDDELLFTGRAVKPLASAMGSFSKGQLKSLSQVGKMVERNGGKVFQTLSQIATYLNAVN